MQRPLLLAIVLTSAWLPAAAHEAIDLSGKALRAQAASDPTISGSPLFAPNALGTSRGSCQETGAALCYDATDRRVVYRAARQYMPRIDGLRAENISLRRDRVVFKYSFR